MSEYVYATIGDPVANALGEIFLPRCEIVRCRDCKWFTPEYRYEEEREYGVMEELVEPPDCGNPERCSHHYDSIAGKVVPVHIVTDPYGFCAWGERRTDQAIAATLGSDAANQPNSESVAQESGESAESATAKCEIRDFVDTREKLEAEIFKCDEDAQKYSFGAVFLDTRKILGWLDRQAAITEREWREKCASDECCDFQELVDANAELQGKVDGLEAERTCRNDKDKWSGLEKYLFVCSECGWNLIDVGNDAIDISARLMKRCPMCGARLEEVGE